MTRDGEPVSVQAVRKERFRSIQMMNWASLAKAIDEMEIQLRNKIEEISREKDYLQTILKGMVGRGFGRG